MRSLRLGRLGPAFYKSTQRRIDALDRRAESKWIKRAIDNDSGDDYRRDGKLYSAKQLRQSLPVIDRQLKCFGRQVSRPEMPQPNNFRKNPRP